MTEDSESNTSFTQQFRWISKFQAGPTGYCSNRTSAGSKWFSTKEEAVADAEKNAENHAKDCSGFQRYDGYDIITDLDDPSERKSYDNEDSDITSSSERFYEESVPSEDSRGLVFDACGDNAPAVGKRKFEEEPSREEDKKQKIEESSEKEAGDGLKIKSTAPISIKLGLQKSKESATVLKKTSSSVAKAFNPDTDSEEEEMPPEAKMRMRNIGRDTPTSAGPNSFGKTRQGFCDTKKVWERKMKEKIREVSDDN